MLAQQERERRKLTWFQPNIHIRMYLNHFAGEHIAHSHPTINWAITWKKALYLSVKVHWLCIKHESTNLGHYFYVSNWKRDRHFTWSSEPREGLAACTAKVVPLFLSYFKDPEYWSGPGNRTRDLLLCSQALILLRWDDFTLIFFGDYNDGHIQLILKMIQT